eukprot:TRINITY_DN14780_c0_g1_i1.p1 TRINITY_DN14780_c0_g1~~TRINITY_DN14780_c0_g1_i1.p1  ORF type:complete len:148 (-),score=15.60 TRINITY_DN14780_c0_g1_i1:70-513(-)
MKLTFLVICILAVVTVIKAQSEDGLIKHTVFLRFPANTTEDVQREVMKRFLALKDLCVNPNTGEPYILSLVAGTANSPEGLDQKMTQGYIVTFSNASDRNYYVGRPFFTPFDPQHDAFKQFLLPLIDGGFIFDFTVGTMPGDMYLLK